MKRGFTLAEVLVTLVIVAGGVVALLFAFSLTLAASSGVEGQNTAVEIASAVMEEVSRTSYANLQDFTKTSQEIFSALTGYSVAVTTTKPNNPAQVNVAVTWPVKGGTAKVELVTLAADY